ncbi:uncharacterized protein AKAME5_002339100 [Lates japonicus]|uniref:Uncharacterized protein n=1 Tax=Lates japonicus TaxID=270547 RepID=A0AAD3NHN6_LATJO|nr:uncharacterized protein AKAME5_002339100 [Lates japonicus]
MDVFIYCLRCLPFIALLITFICFNSRRTKPQQHKPGSVWMDVFIYCLRCLPFIALLITFICFNSRQTKPQQHKPGTFVVIQTPDVSVMEGETVNISCCWEDNSVWMDVFIYCLRCPAFIALHNLHLLPTAERTKPQPSTNQISLAGSRALAVVGLGS